ncbi:rRNA large subunit methyltransferase [Chitinispirillum alkaliphilum]|nr:rRNA large subunit methyltransferase [Chitinispirillum alkaliphilum]
MFLKIAAVGKVKDRNIKAKCQDYISRISHDAQLSISEIKDSDPQTEGRKLLQTMKGEKAFVFAMGEEGRQYSSREFARRLESCNRRAVFVIGGPEGLSMEVKDYAAEIISLSRMTLTHELARLFLLEQLYRGISIIHNRKYHKD